MPFSLCFAVCWFCMCVVFLILLRWSFFYSFLLFFIIAFSVYLAELLSMLFFFCSCVVLIFIYFSLNFVWFSTVLLLLLVVVLLPLVFFFSFWGLSMQNMWMALYTFIFHNFIFLSSLLLVFFLFILSLSACVSFLLHSFESFIAFEWFCVLLGPFRFEKAKICREWCPFYPNRVIHSHTHSQRLLWGFFVHFLSRTQSSLSSAALYNLNETKTENRITTLPGAEIET